MKATWMISFGNLMHPGTLPETNIFAPENQRLEDGSLMFIGGKRGPYFQDRKRC